MAEQNKYNKILDKISKIINRPVPTLKRAGPSPHGLSKFDYISEILPNIDKYVITDKADGVRGILNIESNIAQCIVGSNYFEFAVKAKNMMCDCEFLSNGTILIFDILLKNDKSLIYDTFVNRHKEFIDININSDDRKYLILAKKFIYLKVATYQAEIMKLFMAIKKYKYNTDGIIFTKIDDGYLKTKHYKWKSLDQITIDFLYINNIIYSGISRRVFKQIGLKFPDNYFNNINKYVKHNNNMLFSDFFPIPFMPSIEPNVYKYPIELLPNNADNKIIELSYDNKKKKWKFHKFRTDRDNELKEGHYFGNNFQIAELTFESIINPLTIKDLIKSQNELSKNFYFEKSDQKYKEVRKYNSFIKRKLIKRASYTDKIIDMASGKGQDLASYYDGKIKNLLMLEIDQSAIDEIIKRKFEFSKNIWIDKIDSPININNYVVESTNLTIMQMDLLESHNDNIKKIESTSTIYKKENVNFVICNMALHYLVGSSKDIQNTVKFISYWLKPGGEFIFTSLNAKKINNLLKNTGKWSDKNGIYKIESGKKNHIKVLLPCSRELRDEPLIDLHMLDVEFKKQGMLRIDTADFDKYFSEYNKPLDDDAKEFAALYHYCIYRKNK